MPHAASFGAFWDTVLVGLRRRLQPGDVHSWFADVEITELSPSRVCLALPNAFAVRWIEDHFRGDLEEAVAEAAGARLSLVLVAREAVTQADGGHIDTRAAITEPGLDAPHAADLEVAEVATVADLPAPEAATPSPPMFGDAITEEQLLAELDDGGGGAGQAPRAAVDASPRIVSAPQETLGLPLNPGYRFDTFVIGEANQLAHAAALSVAESPGHSYNPLYIYGQTGLGKTHLLHAIGHYALATQPGVRVAYITTEQFISRFIKTLNSPNKNDARRRFKDYFRSIDVLLVDDVQFLSQKGTSLQEEFFHTFNALNEARRQVVLTSDCEPSEIPKLEDRLRSRFAWGLMTDIARPDRETRIAILLKKTQAEGIDVDEDVLALIAERIATNVRELEGAMTRVIAVASLRRLPITAELTRTVLDRFAANGAAGRRQLTIEDIQKAVCERFGLSHDELVGTGRSRSIARPRQIAMYLSRTLLGAPSTQIGARFGGKDHSTVLHAHDRIESLMQEDQEVLDMIEELTSRLRSGTASVPVGR